MKRTEINLTEKGDGFSMEIKTIDNDKLVFLNTKSFPNKFLGDVLGKYVEENATARHLKHIKENL